ncbi:uncharacterized protein LOC109858896 [Pseudomyrmex gracilis]|uniref:uncharacterized protein LOC109858896 n=1 Tax=Pseudomyrmex gracilis TaxID=219809 RepID=UPI000995188B|nr:uncharacterized protein LOC109858896 [Pseudomyrmex gracilis]
MLLFIWNNYFWKMTSWPKNHLKQFPTRQYKLAKKCQFEEVLIREKRIEEDDYSDEYMLEEETKVMDYIPLEYKIKVVNMAKQHPHWNLKTLQKKGCSRLKNIKCLPRWEKDIKHGGTNIDKYTIINSWTYDRFVEAKNNYQQVTTRDLQQWALSAASQFENFPFKASKAWIRKFKRQHRLKQQKITKYVSAKEAATIDEILAAADIFRKQTRIIIPNFHKDFIINIDQAECQYQSTCDRTLATQRKAGFVQDTNLNKISHSYTAQYGITMSGKILPRVFLCLQEAKGVFDPKVQQAIDEFLTVCTNVVVTSSKSGKLTSNLYTQFLKEILLPYVKKEKFLLIIDSWPGQTNPALYDEIFLDDDSAGTCTIKVVPPKCTPLCQPCDVYFYRQVNNFIKRLQNCSTLIEQNREITSHEDCIKIHSIIHHQLSAPSFQNMLQYAWFASKLTNEREVFMNVNEVCFPIDILKKLCECKNTAFIRCAHCQENYCFACFYDKYHPALCIVPSISNK